ncbi:MAG: hypothetical protein CYPHOPRED_001346 [Cyphobasidiales sp. Tagirdzhanova-0007]|nr:MAG: hypothetical protein CYPHOPRED_001346 [Cyphobasidiales sp. Tagirdzhanova-0007]
MSNGQVIHIGSTQAFDTLLSRAGSVPVFIDFSAEWCGPCKVIGPVYEKIAKEYPKSIFLKVDVDAQKELAERYSIRAMPTFIALKDKTQAGMVRGADEKALSTCIREHAT